MSKNHIFLILLFVAAVNFSFSQNNGFTGYPLPVQLQNALQLDMKTVKTDNNDDIWFAVRNSGVIKFDHINHSWTVFDTTNSALSSVNFNSLFVDEQNGIWVSTYNKGIYYYNGSNWVKYDSLNSGMITNNIYDIAVKNSVVWLASYKGVMYGTPGSWSVFDTTNSGLMNNFVSNIALGDNGTAWFGFATVDGLSEFKSNTWQSWNRTNFSLLGKVTNMLFDNGNLYMQTPGFCKFDGTNFNWYDPFQTAAYDICPALQVRSYRVKQDTIFGAGVIVSVYVKVNDNKQDYFFDNRAGAVITLDSKGKLWSANTIKDSLYSFDSKLFDSNSNDSHLTYSNPNYLDINKVRTMILNQGDMHWNLSDAKYEVPKGTCKNAVYASALWLGGFDDNNALHIAAQTYRQTGCDFFPGPLDTVTGTIDSATAAYYDKIWKINRYDIEEFKYMFQAGEVQNGNYIIPTDMLTWPAQGIANTAKNLAPFIDTNNDGDYNPYDGDYPNIKGDQMLWFVFNDTLAHHSETQGVALGVEVQGSAYSYFCDTLNDTTDVMNTTTFYQYKFINRSANDYHDMYAGLWCDYDLGWYGDDYVGCDTMNDIGFGYNGDNDDEGNSGYGLNPPMINVQILKGPEPVINDGLDNNHNGIIDEVGERCMMNHFHYYNGEPTQWGNPSGANHFYHFLKSEGALGQHVTYGEDGHNPANPPTNYYYSGTPYDTTGWTEASSGNTPGDRRMILSTGPFSLASHQTQTLDFAYVFTRDSTAPNGLTTSIARNIRDVKKIKHWFDVDSFPSCIKFEFPPIPPTVTIDSNILIYPNPAVYNFTLNIADDYINNSEIKIYNSIGELVLKSKLQSKTISVEKLFRKGIYYVVVDKNGELKKGKFLKW